MSRKRRSRRRRGDQENRKDYPAPAERERIIKRRDELMQKLIKAVVMHPGDSRPISRLALRYGPEEMAFVLDVIQNRAVSTEMTGDETAGYREYRHAFARFGGARPFLSRKEYSELSLEYARLSGERRLKLRRSRKPGKREHELSALLLTGVNIWEDITPPAVPERPDGFNAPSPGDYDYSVRTLLDWGWDCDEERIANNARNVTKWRRATPDLVRMALDEELLCGWPGESSSWAPYHALDMLGQIGAYQVAGQLFPLFELEDDWLSDSLAVIWASMGPRAEPPLWDYAGDIQRDPESRSVVFWGLALIAQNHPQRRPDIVSRLAQVLHEGSVDNAEANAYIVHVLIRLQAIEASGAIAEAFEQGKVDESIVAAYDVPLLEWYDDEQV
jgi:hypothetical protein